MVDELDEETETTRTEAAAYLRRFADELESGGKVVFVAGNHSTTVNPPEEIRLTMSAGADESWIGGGDAEKLTFEMSWNAEEVAEDDELSVVHHETGGHGSERTEQIDERSIGESVKSEDQSHERRPGN